MFLTVLSDVAPIAREASEPDASWFFDHADSGPRIEGDVAGGSLHKANVDADQWRAHGRIASRTDDIDEALLTVCVAGELQFLNAARQRLIIEIATECAVSMLDSERRVVRWSTGTQRPKGRKRAKCWESTFRSFFSSEPVEAQVPGDERRATTRGGRLETQARRVRKGASRFRALVSLTAMRGSEDERRGFAS
jgi:hypothetical protein